MNISEVEKLSESSLLFCFESFYYQVLIQKEKALRNLNTIPNQSNKNSEIINEIQNNLKRSLSDQSATYCRMTGKMNDQLFLEVQYIMVALADEIFLKLHFSNGSDWQSCLLEGQIFKTQIAGELFFKRIDVLLESLDSNRFELAQIYLLALSLGFKGKYIGLNNLGEINWYRDQLYNFIYHHPPKLFIQNSPKLIDQCYNHNVTGLPSKGLPDLRSWGKYLAVTFFIYLMISQLVWFQITKGMKDDIHFIKNSIHYNLDGL